MFSYPAPFVSRLLVFSISRTASAALLGCTALRVFNCMRVCSSLSADAELIEEDAWKIAAGKDADGAVEKSPGGSVGDGVRREESGPRPGGADGVELSIAELLENEKGFSAAGKIPTGFEG
jgi:hypothetical protein